VVSKENKIQLITLGNDQILDLNVVSGRS